MTKLNKIETFIIFCIEAYRNKLGLSGSDVINDFNRYNVFEFLENGYEVLHTQSMDYITEEIQEFIRARK